jgi:hypothetical protein
LKLILNINNDLGAPLVGPDAAIGGGTGRRRGDTWGHTITVEARRRDAADTGTGTVTGGGGERPPTGCS